MGTSILYHIFDFFSFLSDLGWQTYFYCLNFLFWFINIFIIRRIVSPPKDPILLKSASKLRELLKKREVTSTEIIESYIKRIEEVNPILNAVVFRNYDEAREQAQRADKKLNELNDEELVKFLDEKPFFGLPFTLKDSLAIKGVPCTVGILSRKKELKPQQENAVAVQRMFDAGAIMLAVTTTPETCLWIETITQAHGKTNNPYDSRRIAGGSSGGEGALQGAGASLMGIGSDLSGSIRIPSYCNGVFGFLATPSKIPLSGHIPAFPSFTYASQMTRIGPITRFAEDIPKFLEILSAGDINQTRKVSLKKMKIFYCEGITHNKKIESLQRIPKEAMMKAINHFEEKFGIIPECVSFPEMSDLPQMQWASMFEEGAPTIPHLMRDIENLGEPVNCYWELVKKLFGQSEYSLSVIITGLHPWNKGFSSERYKELERKREKFKKRLQHLLGEDSVLLYPSWPTQVQYHYETVAKQNTLYWTGLINILLLTAVQCPMGLTDGLPDGVQVLANHGSEKLLLDVAQEISNTFGGWTPPGKCE